MIALLLFKQIFVLFLMMGMGCAIVKGRFLKPDDSKILSTVCLYLVVPCMQIKAFQVHYLYLEKGEYHGLEEAYISYGSDEVLYAAYEPIKTRLEENNAF